MPLWQMVAHIGWRDLVDIVVVAVLIYWILLLLRGTRSLEILLGLAFLVLVFLVSERWGLVTIHWILSNFFESIIIFIIVIFQEDIRRALSTMGKTPFFGQRFPPYSPAVLEEIVDATVTMARLRWGGLIVLEREADIREHVNVGVELDAKVSKELLLSIFNKNSPLHDGAVLIQKGKVTAARCFLPLTDNPRVSRFLGTRHRAALGISERTDAVVIVVSEERGTISLAIKGRLTRDLDMGRLRRVLSNLLIIQKGRKRERKVKRASD